MSKTDTGVTSSGHQTKTKLLVLGGEGFIGRNLTAILTQTHTCVSVGEIQSIFLERADTFLKADPYIQKLPNEYDAIIHLIDNKISQDQFVGAEEKLAKNLFLHPGNHLIVFSSAVVYADPDSEYGQRKILLEKFYTDYCAAQRIPLIIFRPFNLFGPYQMPYRQGSLVANLICNFLNGRSTEIHDMEAQRDFIYACDIPRFVEYALHQKLEGIYDIGSGRLMAIKDLISVLEKKILNNTLNIINRNIREDISSQPAGNDISKSIRMTDFEEGLKRTVDFYRKNMTIVKSYVE